MFKLEQIDKSIFSFVSGLNNIYSIWFVNLLFLIYSNFPINISSSSFIFHTYFITWKHSLKSTKVKLLLIAIYLIFSWEVEELSYIWRINVFVLYILFFCNLDIIFGISDILKSGGRLSLSILSNRNNFILFFS